MASGKLKEALRRAGKMRKRGGRLNTTQSEGRAGPTTVYQARALGLRLVFPALCQRAIVSDNHGSAGCDSSTKSEGGRYAVSSCCGGLSDSGSCGNVWAVTRDTVLSDSIELAACPASFSWLGEGE